MKQMKRLFLLILCACFFSLQINAQSKKVSKGGTDIRVATALNQIKTEYEVVKDGVYMVTYETKDKRTQKVLIPSETETFNGVEFRTILSLAAITDNLPSQQEANYLLQQNVERMGVWTIHKNPSGKYIIANMLRVPADFDGKKLHMALSEVSILADELEKRLSKKDEY